MKRTSIAKRRGRGCGGGTPSPRVRETVMMFEPTQTAGKEEDALGEERAQASLRRPAVLHSSNIISVSVTRVKIKWKKK